MDLLQGFQLNNAADIRHYCNTAPAIEKDEQHISITIPEILFRNAKAFHGITHLAIRAIALSVDFAQENTCQQTSETITIRRGEAQTPFTLTLPAPPEEEITFILLEVQPLYALNGQLQTALHKQGYALGIITILPPTAHPQEIRKVYRNRIPSFWTIPPYPQPTRPSTVIQPVSFSSLPEG
jgi:hypothetical protein